MNREPDALCLDRKIDKIPGVKDVKMKLLAESGISTIQDLIKELYKGTKYESTFHFYHHALGQLCRTDTVAWMEETTVPLHDPHNLRLLGKTRAWFKCSIWQGVGW